METKVRLSFNNIEYEELGAYLQMRLDGGEILKKVENGYAYFEKGPVNTYKCWVDLLVKYDDDSKKEEAEKAGWQKVGTYLNSDIYIKEKNNGEETYYLDHEKQLQYFEKYYGAGMTSIQFIAGICSIVLGCFTVSTGGLYGLLEANGFIAALLTGVIAMACVIINAYQIRKHKKHQSEGVNYSKQEIEEIYQKAGAREKLRSIGEWFFISIIVSSFYLNSSGKDSFIYVILICALVGAGEIYNYIRNKKIDFKNIMLWIVVGIVIIVVIVSKRQPEAVTGEMAWQEKESCKELPVIEVNNKEDDRPCDEINIRKQENLNIWGKSLQYTEDQLWYLNQEAGKSGEQLEDEDREWKKYMEIETAVYYSRFSGLADRMWQDLKSRYCMPLSDEKVVSYDADEGYQDEEWHILFLRKGNYFVRISCSKDAEAILKDPSTIKEMMDKLGKDW